MDVAYINPFIVGALEVLKKMARVEAVAGKPFVNKTDAAQGDVSGIIGITGDAVGSLAISFTNGCICAVVGRMLGEVYTEPTRDVLDAVGEITNMISGVARTRMEKEGLNVYAAIPSVVFGSNHTINHILKSPSIVVPFSTVGGTFFIDVCIRKTKEHEREKTAYGVQNVRTPAAAPTPTPPSAGPPERPAMEQAPPLTRAEKLAQMKKTLVDLIAKRDAMRQQLTDKPFLDPEKRKLYKKNIPLFDARIKKLKLDISALEMLEKMSPEELEKPKLVTHYQHYTKKGPR
ncbi:MAG TPA: chemotaxis protein CheX [Syntrophales bacterium]|nr:chemotaxis protein CheX [Syntrophales bacterium]